MYEAEVNRLRGSLALLPPSAVAEFATAKSRVVRRTVLPWSEHCTECAWPTCYTSCGLYVPRQDGRCRRFVDGMVRIDCPDSINGYLLQIRFKQWGKLWTPGSLTLHTAREAEIAEQWDYRVGSLLQTLPLPPQLQQFATTKRYSYKKRLVTSGEITRGEPTSFLFECYNPTNDEVRLSITFRAADRRIAVPYQQLAILEPGFHAIRIPFQEIKRSLDLTRPFHAEIVPNNIAEELTLYFGLLDFVEERPEPASPKAEITKCVVWDLDNTVWNGILVEDGSASLTLQPQILDVMTMLDEHGILQSIASKNDHGQALEALQLFKLDHLFLNPQVSWAPKGEGIQAIARELNLSLDHMLFIDDSAFEREQVAASCPGIRTMDARDYLSLAHLRECRQPTTSEGLGRRALYRVEGHRKACAASYQDDYKAFLKDCGIRLSITSLCPDNLERVHELTQRTNQMNFSGTRYDRDHLQAILATPYLDTYVLACEDRFGSYGIVGFGLVDTLSPVLTDLMFSCRIQTKRVEHAFLAFLLARYKRPELRGFSAHYRKTPRNEPSGQVFTDLGMYEDGVVDGATLLFFPYTRDIPDDGLVTISSY